MAAPDSESAAPHAERRLMLSESPQRTLFRCGKFFPDVFQFASPTSLPDPIQWNRIPMLPGKLSAVNFPFVNRVKIS